MMKIYLLIAVSASLLFAGPTSTPAHDHVHRRAAKVRKRVRKQAANYVCPMHSDMRSKTRGECAKCGMELVSERRSKDRAVVPVR